MSKSRLLGAVCACVFSFITVTANATILTFLPESVSLESSAFRYGLGGSEGTNSFIDTTLPSTEGDIVLNSLSANPHVNASAQTSALWGAGDTIELHNEVYAINYAFNSDTHAGATAIASFTGSYVVSGSPGDVSVNYGATAVTQQGPVAGPAPDTVSASVALNRDRGGVVTNLFIDSAFILGSSFLSANFDALSGDIFYLTVASSLDTLIGPGESGINANENGQFSILAGLQAEAEPVLATVTAVPVPPVLWLFGSSLLGLSGIAKKRKAVTS